MTEHIPPQQYVEPPTPGWLKVLLALLALVLVIAAIVLLWKQIVLLLIGLIFFPVLWGALKAFVRL